jgi:hypothetical protein
MNNTQFEEATQTYRGTVEPYRWDGEEQGQTFTGLNKPLQVTPEWIARSHLDVFASYWQGQLYPEGNWESFAVKPWAYLQEPPSPSSLIPTDDGAVQQLIQAMAGFAPVGGGSTGGSVAGSYSAMQMMGVDGGT